MSDATSRWHWCALAAVIVGGAVLRFTSLGHGIPFAIGVDEPEIMDRAVRMMKTGDLHPRFFDYPGLYLYLQFIVATLRFMVGGMQGLWANMNQAPVEAFYLWGRAVTALFGTATIVLVYLAGRRVSPRAGLLAAALFAVQSLHVRESHFVLTDVPTTFFVALSWVLTLRALERRTWQASWWVGVAVGAAAATKYNGGVALLLPLLGMLLAGSPWRDRVRQLAWTVVGAAVTFLVCAPYTILALPEFLNAFVYLSHMYAVGPAPVEPAWVTYLKHLRNNVSIPGLLAAAGGAVLAGRALWREPASRESRVLMLAASFALFYFWMIAGQRLVWGRYLMPLLPFLCVLAGAGIAWVATRVAARWPARPTASLVAATLVIAAAVQPATNAANWLAGTRKTGTPEQLYRWALEHLPRGSKIATESREVLLPGDQYRLVFPRRLINHDADYYQREGFDYLLASSQSFRVAFYVTPPEPQALAAYTDLFRRTEHVITFMPSDDHPGPEFRVFRVLKPE